jgi:CRISPR/Cas system-associated exonuclease Cas4 (RecB family)
MFNHVDHGVELPKITRAAVDGKRLYTTPEGKAYPSITTVLSVLSKQGILEWRQRVGEEEANKISRQAATRGTAVHKLAEDYLDNVEDWKGKHMPANLNTFNDLRNVIDGRLDNVWMQEEFLYSDRLKCAGQVDCIAEYDGVLSVIDFKTSRKPKKEEWITSYFIQTSFYAAAFFEQTGIPIKQAVILIAVDGHESQVFKINTYDYLEHFVSVRKKYKELYESR